MSASCSRDISSNDGSSFLPKNFNRLNEPSCWMQSKIEKSSLLSSSSSLSSLFKALARSRVPSGFRRDNSNRSSALLTVPNISSNLFLRILVVGSAFALVLYAPYVQQRASTRKTGQICITKTKTKMLWKLDFVFVLQIFNVRIHLFSYLRPH